MRSNNPLTAAIVIASATALVVLYAFLRPEQTLVVLVVYLATIISLSVIVYFVSKMYGSLKTSVDADDFTDITEDLNSEIIIWFSDFSYVFMNKRIRELLEINGIPYDEREMLKKAFEVDDLTIDNLKPILQTGSHEASFLNSEGKLITIAWSTSLVKKRKNYSVYISTGFNLTEIRTMKVNLASANDFFNSSMELAEIGVIMSTDRHKYVVSSIAMDALGLKHSSIDVGTLRSLIHPNDRIQFDRALKSKDADNGEVKNIEIRIRSFNGTAYRWYSFRYKSLPATENMLPLFGGALLDITQEHEKDILIERLAYIDEVTEIANRNKLVTTGRETYECSKLLNYTYWIIVLDIDRFHIVNDTYGYTNGNHILRDFAHILYKFVTPGGLAARISGDNFALVLRDYGDDELPVRTARSIQEEFAKLAVDDFGAINLTCSAGFSKMPDDGNSFLDVMEHAEFALKSGDGTNGSICGYEPSMHDSIIGNTELEKSLALAIDNNELQLFYQPKIDLKTGKIIGVEALIRWIKPDGTVIKPDAFVPIAESSHLIGKISEFVLKEGCRQNKLWQKMGFPNIVMSINFTSTDFYQTDLKEKVLDALAMSGLDPQWLEVELTETLALSDIDYAVAQMNKLRELGVKLAMDDFGTGYSSLSYLQILPITLLKLDRSFITDIQHDNIAYEIVSAVIRIAKSKKIETIAEGIENTGQEDILRQAGCDYGQGYLYGKPMPANKLEEFFYKNANVHYR
ncbi:MAG: EAL domain-containing protein [Ruminococcus sp.]|nr:EAL domain-containing protein [Ruminococcus sp.]